MLLLDQFRHCFRRQLCVRHRVVFCFQFLYQHMTFPFGRPARLTPSRVVHVLNDSQIVRLPDRPSRVLPSTRARAPAVRRHGLRRAMPCRSPLVGSNELSQLHQQNQNEQYRGENGSNNTLKDGDGATPAAKAIERTSTVLPLRFVNVMKNTYPTISRTCCLAEIVAQILHRFRIDLVEMLGIVLAKQNGRRFGGIARLEGAVLTAEYLVDRFQWDALGCRPMGMTPRAVSAVIDRGDSEHDLFAKRLGSSRPEYRPDDDGRRNCHVGDRFQNVARRKRTFRHAGDVFGASRVINGWRRCRSTPVPFLTTYQMSSP